MRLIALFLTLMALTSACGTVAVDGACPPLAAPPVAALDTLQSAHDPAIDAWVVALDRHYLKLEACRG